eukprot:TRINITY_DN67934_c0_g1_i1.p1 TRINITY_DN67934_c0_g1~~TRINITY_DN67934_c0_g1_i1.p1  ORF type:complete len:253 (-),score=15.00 TRINITY_DN67934_c0_g1_i1:500-1258(-)
MIRPRSALSLRQLRRLHCRNVSQQEIEATKARILQNSLAYVHTEGWTTQAIAKACEDENLSPMSHGLFKNGAADLVHSFQIQCNRNMTTTLLTDTELQQEMEQADTQQRLHRAIKLRLSMVIPYLPNWHEAVAIACSPGNAPRTLVNAGIMADEIWYYALGTNIDQGPCWLLNRTAILALYAATEAHLMTDTSVDYEKTWQFLWDAQTAADGWKQTADNAAALVSSGSALLMGSATQLLSQLVAKPPSSPTK